MITRQKVLSRVRVVAISLILFCLILSVKAQIVEIGVTAGGSYYLGDLNPGIHFRNSRFMYGLVSRYHFDTRWCIRLSGTFAEVGGDAVQSSFLPERGLSFTSKITDISSVMEFNFLPFIIGSERSAVTTYIFAGIGVFFFNPQSGGMDLKPLGTEGQNEGYEGRSPYSTTSVSVPFGLGGKFSVAKKLSLQVYWEVHKTFTDYIDDISTTYYLEGKNIKTDNLGAVMSDPTLNHTPGMQRGNPGNNDWYFFYGLALTYKIDLSAKNHCKEMEH